ncbi:MAG: hypothetical protein AAF401_16255 [Pseudomonadota bacterium]
MVRRVGFGDRYGERRTDKRIETAERTSSPRRSGVSRVFIGGFLIVWLVGWTSGIVFALSEIVEQGLGAADFGLFVWVAFAVIGWIFAVVMLFRVITGRPLGKSKGGHRHRPTEFGGNDRGFDD